MKTNMVENILAEKRLQGKSLIILLHAIRIVYSIKHFYSTTFKGEHKLLN